MKILINTGYDRHVNLMMRSRFYWVLTYRSTALDFHLFFLVLVRYAINFMAAVVAAPKRKECVVCIAVFHPKCNVAFLRTA